VPFLVTARFLYRVEAGNGGPRPVAGVPAQFAYLPAVDEPWDLAAWRSLGSGTTDATGTVRFAAALSESGTLRVGISTADLGSFSVSAPLGIGVSSN